MARVIGSSMVSHGMGCYCTALLLCVQLQQSSAK